MSLFYTIWGKTKIIINALGRMIEIMGIQAYLEITRRPLSKQIQTLANKFMS